MFKRIISNIISPILLINFINLHSQEQILDTSDHELITISEDTLVTRVVDCNSLFTLNNRKIDYLKNRPYIYAEPYYERAYNDKKEYGVFQLGKRKGTKPFLYIKLFKFNTCLKQDEVLEFILDNDYRYRINNIYKPNCDGIFIGEITHKDIKKLEQGYVKSLKVLTFDEDFEFHLTDEKSEKFRDELQCLRYQNFKYK